MAELYSNDDPRSWETAGFVVIDGRCAIDGIDIVFQQGSATNNAPGNNNAPGISGWGFETDSGANESASLAGISTRLLRTESGASEQRGIKPTHPNGVTRIDHVVVMTGDAARMTAEFDEFGLELRRHRPVPALGIDQYFYRAGTAIIEVVCGSAQSHDAKANATIWGLAVVSEGFDATVEYLDANVSPPKDAVQPGRRIATIRTALLGISTEIAVMSPHVPRQTSHA